MKFLYAGIVAVVLLSLVMCGTTGAPGVADGVLVDGLHYAEDEADQRGWIGTLWVEVQDGEIVDVSYEEIQRTDAGIVSKMADEEYAKRWYDQQGVNQLEAFPAYEEQFKLTTDPKVDALTNATGSANRFSALAARVLEGEFATTKLSDGVHYAEDEADQRGWIGTLEVTARNGRIVSVSYDEVQNTADGVVSKMEDAGYAERWYAAQGVNQLIAFPRFEAQLRVVGEAENVDAVTNATGSANRFRSLAAEILN